MAVTITFISATHYRMFYNMNHDGAAGNNATRTNAQLLADAAGSPDLQALLNTPVATDVDAVLLMTCAVGQPGAVTHIMPGSALGAASHDWAVDYEADGNNRVRMLAFGEAGFVSEAIFEIQIVHTYNK